MAQANLANFLDSNLPPVLARPKVYAPGEAPNAKNPGGISDNAYKAKLKQAALVKAAAQQAAALAASKKATAARMLAQQKEAAAAASKRSGGVLGDLARLSAATAAVVGTAAAVVATGGAAAGALGFAAGVGGIAAGAAVAGKAAKALQVGSNLAAAASTGNTGGVVNAGLQGLQLATGKTPAASFAAAASLALPGLASGAKDVVAAARAAADKVIAAAELGVAKAKEVFDATKALALTGHKDAIAAVAILAATAKERAAAKVPLGQPRPLTARAEYALTTVMLPSGAAVRPATAAPVKPPAPAPVKQPTAAPVQPAAAQRYLDAAAAAALAPAVQGQLVHTEGERAGRLNFSSSAWRPCAATAPGAIRGLVVSNEGRIAFDQDWLPA